MKHRILFPTKPHHNKSQNRFKHNNFIKIGSLSQKNEGQLLHNKKKVIPLHRN